MRRKRAVLKIAPRLGPTPTGSISMFGSVAGGHNSMDAP